MEVLKKIKKLENLHILVWLIKDSCWMLELQWLAIFMIIPAVSIAILTVFLTKKTSDVFINLAILCWIIANSIWMLNDFLGYEYYKYFSATFFATGLFFYFKHTLIEKPEHP